MCGFWIVVFVFIVWMEVGCEQQLGARVMTFTKQGFYLASHKRETAAHTCDPSHQEVRRLGCSWQSTMFDASLGHLRPTIENKSSLNSFPFPSFFTWGLTHARQAFYYWAISPAFILLFSSTQGLMKWPMLALHSLYSLGRSWNLPDKVSSVPEITGYHTWL